MMKPLITLRIALSCIKCCFIYIEIFYFSMGLLKYRCGHSEEISGDDDKYSDSLCYFCDKKEKELDAIRKADEESKPR